MMFLVNTKYSKRLPGNIWITYTSGFNNCSDFITLEDNINIKSNSETWPNNQYNFITFDLSSDSKVEVAPFRAI